MSQSEKAVPPVIAIQKQQDAAPKAPATTSGLPHQQFKIVRVRKPDGTIVKVKRPIDGEEAAKLTTVPAKSKHASITQVSDSEKANGVAQPPAKAEPAAVAATEVKTTSEKEKSDPVVKTVTSNKPTKAAADPEKVEEASTKSVDPASPVPDPASPNKTARVLNHVANGSRIYRGFHKLHKGSSKLVSVLAPQWGLEDWQEGDEDYSDDDNDSDENEEKYDEDEDDGKIVKEGAGSHGASGQDVNAAAKTITTAAVSDLPYLNTPGPQPEINEKETIPTSNSKPSKPEITEKDTKPTTNGKLSKPDKTAVVNGKEVSASDMESGCIEKPIASEGGGKSLVKKYTDWSRYIIWAIMILFPMLFMVIAILVAVRDGESVGDPLGVGTDQALKVAISIWPIIYAGIVAQSLRAYATYKVERGVRLMTLEQLVNSNSVAASVKQPFLLRRFNWITVALLMLWGLSPLATQAMQRISDLPPTNITNSSLRYIDTVINANYLAASKDIFNIVEPEFNRLYSAAFLPTTYNQGSDAYGNTLIPLLDSYDSTTWQDIDPYILPIPSNYASIYGIPIASLWNDISSFDYTQTFNGTIEAAYLSFTCPPLTILSEDVINNMMDNNTLNSFSQGTTTTLYLGVTAMNGTSKGSLALASMITLNTTDPNKGSNVDISSPNFTYAFTNCSFSQVFMDAKITCQDTGCFIYSILPKNKTQYANSGAENWVTGLTGSSGVTDTTGKTITSTDTERFLMGGGNYLSGPQINLTTAVDISQSLTYLMNTFWMIGFAPNNIAGLFFNNTPILNQNLTNNTAFAKGIIITPQNTYKTNWGWLAALMICSLSLLLAGVFSIWWDARTVSPDVLGFASSVVRKSKYVKLPPVKSSASGAERARALGDVRVMMQDVKPGASVGRIALGTAHPNAKRLVPGRTYW